MLYNFPKVVTIAMNWLLCIFTAALYWMDLKLFKCSWGALRVCTAKKNPPLVPADPGLRGCFIAVWARAGVRTLGSSHLAGS